MTKATFTSTKEARSAGATFTPQPMAEPFGWQGRKHARRAAQAPPTAQARSLGQMEPGRIADFEQGMHDAWDKKARTAAIAIGTYAAVRGLQRLRG